MRKSFTIMTAIAMATAMVPLVVAESVAPEGPITNGAFENPFVPSQVYDALEGSPADTCVGVGHQIMWGDGSTQQVLLGDHPLDSEEDAETEPNPDGVNLLAKRFVDDDQPVNEARDEALLQSGLGHCVWNPREEGIDLAWVQPAEEAREPSDWSIDDRPERQTAVEFGYGFDNDPFDREVRITATPGASSHNIWQSGAKKHQAYTMNYDVFTFEVENWGQIKDLEAPFGTKAFIQITFSVTPSQEQNPWIGIFADGSLTFDAATIEEKAREGDGTVTLSPVHDVDSVSCRSYPPCLEIKEDLGASPSTTQEEEEKRALLGRLRIVQMSFWRFNHAPQDLVLDDVEIAGYTTVADELATGNLHPNTPETE